MGVGVRVRVCQRKFFFSLKIGFSWDICQGGKYARYDCLCLPLPAWQWPRFEKEQQTEWESERKRERERERERRDGTIQRGFFRKLCRSLLSRIERLVVMCFEKNSNRWNFWPEAKSSVETILFLSPSLSLNSLINWSWRPLILKGISVFEQQNQIQREKVRESARECEREKER